MDSGLILHLNKWQKPSKCIYVYLIKQNQTELWTIYWYPNWLAISERYIFTKFFQKFHPNSASPHSQWEIHFITQYNNAQHIFFSYQRMLYIWFNEFNNKPRILVNYTGMNKKSEPKISFLILALKWWVKINNRSLKSTFVWKEKSIITKIWQCIAMPIYKEHKLKKYGEERK